MTQGTITVTNLTGRTVSIGNDGIKTVKDALNHYFAGNIPSGVKAEIQSKEVSMTTSVRENDVIVVRQGEFARKREISGALN